LANFNDHLQNLWKSERAILRKTIKTKKLFIRHRTLLSVTARHANKKLTAWILQNFQKQRVELAFCGAIESKNKEFIQWLLLHFGLPDGKNSDADGLCAAAAAVGDKDMLTLLKSKNYKIDRDSFHEALENGNLDLVQWMFQLGIRTKSGNSAAREGHYEVTKWLWQQGIHSDLRAAAMGGNLDLVKFIAQQNREVFSSPDLPVDAAASSLVKYGQYWDIVQWLLENTTQQTKTALSSAAAVGNFSMVKFLVPYCEKENSNESSFGAIESAILHFHFDIALYLLEKFPDAVQQNDFVLMIQDKVTIELLEFLHLHSVPYSSKRAFWVALGNGNVDVVEWMIKNDADLKGGNLFPFHVNLAGAQWIFQKHLHQPNFFDPSFWDPDLIGELLVHGNVEVAKFFLTNIKLLDPIEQKLNHPAFSLDMIPTEFIYLDKYHYKPNLLLDVCRAGYLSILEFTHQQKWFSKVDWDLLKQTALESQNFHIVEWIEDQTR
jgi:hypothetical protein